MKIAVLFSALLLAVMANAQNAPVKVSGAMKNVMWKGQLQATIIPDTLANKTHLYGLGPIAGLKGEILVEDGHCYTSKALPKNKMSVTEDRTAGAPFFVYANVAEWKEVTVPPTVTNLQQLEEFLLQFYPKDKLPFAFRVTALAKTADIHIVNLPDGSTVTNPDEAHQGQQNYTVTNQPVRIVGFFSTLHKGVFTHHTTNLHAHLITQDNTMMGHLESITFGSGKVRLFIAVK
jgi:acetolactate decarboxylase